VKNLLIILSIVLLPGLSFSQPDKSQLALEYYKNKEFDKARIIYEELFNANPSRSYFNYFLACLIELKEYDEAEKQVKKLVRKNPQDLSYRVDLGYLYRMMNDTKKSESAYTEALEILGPNQGQILSLAGAFLQRQEWGFAEKTYLQGRKLLKGSYGFQFELAGLYQSLRNYDAMISEYLDVLEIQESYLQSVQNRLQSAVYSDRENNLTQVLKSHLIKRIQKKPDIVVFNELLIWLYLQERDYKNAYTFASALDKRNKEEGYRILELGRLAAKDSDFETAITCFQAVIDKGKWNPFYGEARYEHLNTLYKKITKSSMYTEEEVLNLESLFIEALNELGKSKNTFGLMKDLAHIQAFYLGKLDLAITSLEEALNKGLSPYQSAECRMELGDIYLYDGRIWDATIYYAQVEKEFSQEPIGHEAKFRKSRLAYFAGDFIWAQAQLDILKASTSKLISNDAFALSMLISDNLAYDSTGKALRQFSRADLMMMRKNPSGALNILDSIIQLNEKQNSILDDAYLRKGQVLEELGKWSDAAACYDTVRNRYNWDITADDALFRQAYLYDKKLNNPERAKELYEDLILNYPGSIYTVEARIRYRILRGELIPAEELIFLEESQ
jgi:tetratricopeptide (TPR) repeat protein